MDSETLRDKLRQLKDWLVKNGFVIRDINFEIRCQSHYVRGDAIPLLEAPRWEIRIVLNAPIEEVK